MKTFSYYFKILKILTLNSFQVSFVSRLGAILFTIGKILRFLFFGFLLWLLATQTKSLAGYTFTQTLIFYLTFNIIDTLSQMLFRDVYRFRQYIVSGDFDLILIKPVNALFRVLFGGIDVLDTVLFVPYVITLIVLLMQMVPGVFALLSFIVLILNGFVIAAAFHIAVMALGILTTEIDHAIMIYRDVTSMVRFPVDIYREPLRSFITFVIPVGVMMTFPPKALFGLLSPLSILTAMGIAALMLYASLLLWKHALTQYTSASS